MKNLFFLTVAAFFAVSCCDQQPKSNVELFAASAFDTTINNQAVSLYTLTNANGMSAQFTNYGARLVDLWVPSADGTFKDVVWGYESIKDYLNSTDLFCGPIVGRYGNRIGAGKFSLDSTEYILTINNGENHLHGGTGGFGTKIWNTREFMDQGNNPSIEMSYTSVDGEEGYPGNVEIKVVYTISPNNELIIKYMATTDAPTIINPTSHAYFNLHGTSSESTNSHVLTINADSFTPTDAGLIPTGEIVSVEGTPLDFRTATAIGSRIASDYEPMVFAGGYDHNWALNKQDSATLSMAAEVYEPATGIIMRVITDQPGIQFYSGNFMDGIDKGKRGDMHNLHTGIALETQNFPDAPNHNNFPSAVLRPGETYYHTAIYAFEVKK